ncbi:MarR family winged helix-turn-helix transcriptional regulator [Actinomycetes bacterium NPDC127524]|uniref:MarR family winged helix-turn-helix transcriptional regulator n=1 Tax=Bacillus sp. OV322 TaxID=1882764 RepID=UPI0008EBC81B|nr:MarR family transcriptional regulator [Bacillus sp. OV322]SFC84850.1 DNA-binding transcriptional regulator, MarR family [Bacillus sp. OV322]
MNEESRIIAAVEHIHDKLLLLGKIRTLFLEKSIEPYDITLLQVHILYKVGQNSNIRVSKLAEMVHIHLSSLTRLIDRLVEQTLICRFNDDKDRRVVRVQLSDKGSEVLECVTKSFKELIIQTIKQMDETELEGFYQFSALLDKITEPISIENDDVKIIRQFNTSEI